MQHPNHPDHDLLLIAAHAAGDATVTDGVRAQSLLETCPECVDLHRDLLSITATSRSLRAAAAATAPRDFRITPEQAARLRRGSWLRTVLAPFGGARSAARPMATAFTSLGVAGLLVATVLPGMLGGAASTLGSAPERDMSQGGAVASAAPAGPGAGAAGPTLVPAAGYPGVRPVANGPSQAPDVEYGVKDGTSTPPDVAIAGSNSTQAPEAVDDMAGRLRASVSPPSPLFLGSIALLALGLLLFGLRFAGRRLR